MNHEDESQDKQGTPGEPDEAKPFLPPLDVSSLILPFYTQALLKMGLIEDPDGELGQENLELAKRMIDLLELFQNKTRDHLETEEQKFLESILHQLKMHYMEKAKLINR
ncbi:MAG: DUF1844 domain-containing protein [Candidatus Aminicenantes bacterium]|nr:DUF1844 domain-containing protein [Candidatus Aminicenantes bacterium]